ncbi:Signal transduction histidine kinase [Streptomyces zhaozhouensis]|uniref:histidine kinase n=1 Tax=Streptomyces zhaozhouensis TaxID=1300267 RepID=A0A286DWU6_9ACTN|nr:histidine kinase [Streptomyces zhaozhouensis]SOD63141.1 Signal transduction histidine kinase [Streptomyces zhaozhouensis]
MIAKVVRGAASGGLARDLALSAAIGCLTAADLASNVPGSREDDALSWLLLGVAVVGLCWQRRRPLLAVVVTGVGSLGWTLLGHLGELLNLPWMVALYFLACSSERRRTVVIGVLAAAASGIVSVLAGQEEGRSMPSPVLEMAIPLVPLLLGEVVRGRRELTASYAERARRAEQEREREAARRVREERMRIAREMHDIVAHTVSAMTVQAGVALDALDRRPELSRSALRQVRDSGREAIRELRTTLSVLRDDESTPVAPAPRLAQLPELIARFPGDRPRITLRGAELLTGGRPLPPVVELTAYRIVQEALTNVVRHSRADHATVALSLDAEGPLVVEVVDDGPARAEHTGAGLGLVGMRERATAITGTLSAGPLPDGGFRVHARLPLDEHGGGREGEGGGVSGS